MQSGPRGKQFGYLFTKTALKLGDKAIYRTIAHEIAHGAFHLNHTFDSQCQNAQASTQNLMDYTSGTVLLKHQWDAIHNPGMEIGMFEKDEEGMLIANTYYWTPAGTPIYMPKTSTTVLNLVKLKNGEHLNGILYSWKEVSFSFNRFIRISAVKLCS